MTILYEDPQNFADADEFIDCFERGCEAQFTYAGKMYSVTHAQDDRIVVCESYKKGTAYYYDSPQAALDHLIEGKRIGSILQEMEMIKRTLH